jgi:L-iditol 2-dehydrogenase
MRVSVLRRPHDVAVEERPDPTPGPHEVLVRITSVGVCGSDVHYYEHGRIGSAVVEAPLVLGHEPAGVVVALGHDVSRLEVGQRVSIEPGRPDFICEQCRAGRYNLCDHMRFFGTPPIDGAFAELVTVHELFAHPVPDSLSDDAAAMLEPVSVGLWACRKAGVSADSRVLVTGAGPVGLLAAQVAMALGAVVVTVSDVNEHRLDVARQLGVGATLDVSSTSLATSGVRADVLLECSGHTTALVEAINLVDRAGRVVMVGMGSDDVPLPVSRIQEYELQVTGTFRYAHTWPTAIALAASGQISLDPLVTNHFGLDDVEKALTATHSDPTAIKQMVSP